MFRILKPYISGTRGRKYFPLLNLRTVKKIFLKIISATILKILRFFIFTLLSRFSFSYYSVAIINQKMLLCFFHFPATTEPTLGKETSPNRGSTYLSYEVSQNHQSVIIFLKWRPAAIVEVLIFIVMLSSKHTPKSRL